MAFQIKDFPSIAAGMINRMRATTTRITDFNVGSKVRTMLEAAAIEIDQLYQQMFNGLKEAIPVATYNSFDFSRLAAVPASGLALVTITVQATNTIIAAGTVFTPPGSLYTYVALSDTTINAGSTTANVLIAANVGGIATNIAAATAFTLNPSPAGFVSAANAAAFTNGADLETDDQRKFRFTQFIQALARGTIAAIKYGVKTTTILSGGVVVERVQMAQVIEPWLTDNTQPIGLINVFIHNGVGSTSGALVTQANTIIYGYYDANGNAVPGWKAAGTKVVVAAATETTRAVTAVLTPAVGYDGPTLNATASAAISSYILSLDIGASFEIADVMLLVMSIPGVQNFLMSSPSPTADVTIAADHKFMPGTIAITNP